MFLGKICLKMHFGIICEFTIYSDCFGIQFVLFIYIVLSVGAIT